MVKFADTGLRLFLAAWIAVGLSLHWAVDHAHAEACALDAPACLDCCDDAKTDAALQDEELCHDGCACGSHDPNHSAADHAAAGNCRLKTADAEFLSLCLALLDRPVAAAPLPLAQPLLLPDDHAHSNGLRAPPLA